MSLSYSCNGHICENLLVMDSFVRFLKEREQEQLIKILSFLFYIFRHDDLKEMLDSNKDSLKLEAMKRIVAMIARGKNASDLFPAVVKNVACKNIEVKKLVYVYLVRYAEEQQDLALLSISTFQRGLKDPNQLIRASALRVLSSIRVTIIVPIMMLAIKEAASDMSPYVRKTAAHAIPKLHSLDPEQKDQLIEVIEKLLADKTTLVAGSVVMAFEEVCPDRIDLIHKNYRKLCNLLIDVEEWGQVVIINMLTRYARTQFLNPNESLLEESSEKAFYASDDEEDEDKKAEVTTLEKRKPYVMDPDHRLLLRNTKPLLQSRNAAVVMAVAQLYFHLAPKAEVGIIAKALGMFEPYLKSFYIRSTDPTQIKILKLEVLTNLANEANISTILREFQTYIKSMDKDFVAASIQAIGRCATNIGEVRDTCLNGLVQLLSNRDELVVAESVVVIKKLLQMQPEQHSDIIKHMAKLIDNIQVPMARASILWLIGEYCEHVPKIAPDVLRKMAKSFTNEEDIVKLQIINLAAKLYLTNSKQTKLLTQYVLNLAKYDQNYDIRDRARFIRQLIVPTDKSGALNKYAKKLFLALKPAPVLESPFKDRDHFQLGSLSHLLNAKAAGYQELPDWPESAPDPSVRNVEVKDSVCAERTVLTGPEGAGVLLLQTTRGSSNIASGSDESGSGSESEESREETESEEEEEDEEEEKKKRKKLDKTKAKKQAEESAERCTIAPSGSIKMYELLHRITGEGLAVEYCFSLQPSESVTVVMGIDFCDSTQAANFQLCTHTRKFFVSIQPPVGELMTPTFLTENNFKKEQGERTSAHSRFNTHSCPTDCSFSSKHLTPPPPPSAPVYRFAGKTVSSGCLVLVTVTTKEGGGAQLTVNCEKMVIGTMLVKDILQALSQ
uniref:AP-3 complex subunit beta C-terminal domain-containing protein n=1 Tax=Sinocyclocheilus anshuiensis TaxID=1608454 RepID=A0A671S2B7_9TELE